MTTNSMSVPFFLFILYSQHLRVMNAISYNMNSITNWYSSICYTCNKLREPRNWNEINSQTNLTSSSDP